jgi:hypothetical protein
MEDKEKHKERLESKKKQYEDEKVKSSYFHIFLLS